MRRRAGRSRVTGSTGEPKGVPLTETLVAQLLELCRERFGLGWEGVVQPRSRPLRATTGIAPTTEVEVEALLLEQPLRLPGDLAVEAEEDVVEVLEHGDPRAEPAPHRAQLDADHPGADHQPQRGPREG